MTDTRTWQERRDGHNTLYVSPTVINTVTGEDGCYRKWWFAKVRRLQEAIRGSKAAGTALHAVAKRFFDADDRGYDSTGQPVTLYPADWFIVEEEFDDTLPAFVLDKDEQQMVRTFVDKAISSGIWTRHAGRVAEEKHDFEFGEKMVDGKKIKVQIRCSLDIHLPAEIQDHKTCKSQKYAENEKTLKKDNQALLYSWLHFRRNPKAVAVRFTHNQFIKDTGNVKQVTVVITRDMVDEWLKTVFMPTTHELVLVRQKAQDWTQIGDPSRKDKACMAYGGCPFLPICQGQITPEQYEQRMTNYFGRLREDRLTKLKKENPMFVPGITNMSPVGGGLPQQPQQPAVAGGQSPLTGFSMPVNTAMPQQQQQYQPQQPVIQPMPQQQQYQPQQPVQQFQQQPMEQYQATPPMAQQPQQFQQQPMEQYQPQPVPMQQPMVSQPVVVQQDTQTTPVSQAPADNTAAPADNTASASVGYNDSLLKEKSGFTVLIGCMITKGFAAGRTEVGGQKRSLTNGESVLASIYDYMQENYDKFNTAHGKPLQDIMSVDPFKRQELIAQAFAERFAGLCKTCNLFFRTRVSYGDMGALQQVCCMYADMVIDTLG